MDIWTGAFWNLNRNMISHEWLPLTLFKGEQIRQQSNKAICASYLTQNLNKGHGYHTMAWELSMVKVAHVGPYQGQLTHIPCWGRGGPWWGCGGVQSLKIGHFLTSFPDFPGLQNQVLRYFWVNWTLIDPQEGFGVVLHIDFWSISILSQPYPKRAFYSRIWRPKIMENF